MSAIIINYTWHPRQSRWRYPVTVGAVAVLAVVAWLATRGESGVWPRVLAPFMALVTVGLLIEQDTRIDSEAGMVVREGRLFGRCRVWLRRHRLSEFTRVDIERQGHQDGSDTLFVGLRRPSGQLMTVCYFCVATDHRSIEAEGVARSLAEATGLRWHDNEP